MFDIASLTEVLYPLELPFCATKLKVKDLNIYPLQVTLATLVLEFLDIFVVIYAITSTLFGNIHYSVHSVKYL